MSGGDAMGGSNPNGWVAGWLDWTSDSDNTNTIFLTDARYAKLAPYSAKSSKIYRCPADHFLSTQQRQLRFTERVRSISMNACMGFEPGKSFGDYRAYLKMNDITVPSPSMAWVFLDEREDSINDGEMVVGMFGYPDQPSQWKIVDYPASYHLGAAGFAFADGHSEIRKWRDPDTLAQHPPPNPVGPNDAPWIQFRASAAKNPATRYPP